MEVIWIVQVVAIIILFIDIFYIVFQNPSRMQVNLVLMATFTAIMMIGYLAEIAATSLEYAMAGVKIAYIGKPFALLFSLLFITEYCGYSIPKKWTAVLIVYHAIFPIIVYTNDYHHLYYASVGFKDVGSFSALTISRGPLYYLYMATLVANFVVTLIITLKEYKRCQTRKGRQQALTLLGMFGSTVIGYLIYLLGWTGGYDSTMAGAFVGVVLLTITFVRGGFFDTMTEAKDRALNDAAMGLLVLNPQAQNVYSNTMVNTLQNEGLTLSKLKELDDGTTVMRFNERVLEIKRSPLINSGRDYGSTLEITDITDRFTYSEKLEKEVENRTQEIKNIQRSIIISFAGLVEARDDSTGAHIGRVSKYTEIIARQLQKDSPYSEQLTEDYITCLVDVAPLHDIGKISVPDSVLLKPGRLTEGEFAIIQSHTVNGGKVIHQCLDGVEQEKYIKMAEEVAVYHHEWWNGIGYPNKIAGTDIPLAARIVAIADVYDAVRSRRCYKPPFSLEKSREEIVKDSGTHFDPVIVDAFLAALPEIEAISADDDEE